MARVAWHLDTVVLNHVLLDNCVASSERGRLSDSLRVKVSLRDESVIAWDMRRGLRGAHS